MYTLAMQGCVVTSTGFEKEAKSAIQKRVEMMGGIYANAFTDQVTHLVARVVRSAKYDVALRKETPIMTDEWVEKVFMNKNNIIWQELPSSKLKGHNGRASLPVNASPMATKQTDEVALPHE